MCLGRAIQDSDGLGQRGQGHSIENDLERSHQRVGRLNVAKRSQPQNEADAVVAKQARGAVRGAFNEITESEVTLARQPFSSAETTWGRPSSGSTPTAAPNPSCCAPGEDVPEHIGESRRNRRYTRAMIRPTAHTVSFRNACLPRPRAKNANRQLSCSMRSGRVTPSARKAILVGPIQEAGHRRAQGHRRQDR